MRGSDKVLRTVILGSLKPQMRLLSKRLDADLSAWASSGRLPEQVNTWAGPNSTLDLTGQAQAVVIDLGADLASPSSGFSGPSLTINGTPDAVILSTGPAIVEYALQPSSAIETVATFAYDQDLLNIDLLGSAANSWQAHDTSVGGVHAIAIASSTDPAMGCVAEHGRRPDGC